MIASRDLLLRSRSKHNHPSSSACCGDVPERQGSTLAAASVPLQGTGNAISRRSLSSAF